MTKSELKEIEQRANTATLIALGIEEYWAGVKP